MKITFSHDTSASSDILCIFSYENQEFENCPLNPDIKARLMAALETIGFKGKKGEVSSILSPQGLSVSQLLVIGLGEQGKLKPYDALYIGAGICARLKNTNATKLSFDLRGLKVEQLEHFSAQLIAGFVSRTYHFLKYHTYEKNNRTLKVNDIHVATDHPQVAEELYHKEKAILDGTFFTRDLLCEPPNVLYPNTMADRLKELEPLGVEVQVLDEQEMENLGMGALLGVGQGSIFPPRLVTLKWNGLGNKEAPLAFVGKGITFDTGGISIKPSNRMDEMKFDMGGAAVVSGLIKSLALRKAKVNVVGVVALAENMPDGAAQRPGDIVKSMSGQTIEILDTDAEGRLVLADALWYAQEKFQPKAVIDLATLTGAIVICLGEEQAGIFSNDDLLADQLTKAGLKTNERVWRLPLDEVYDKMIDSDIADMKNVSRGRGAGSITAAQFLGRFVKKGLPWTHIDVAGVVSKSIASHPLSGHYPSGYGVRLLNTFISDHYEQ